MSKPSVSVHGSTKVGWHIELRYDGATPRWKPGTERLEGTPWLHKRDAESSAKKLREMLGLIK